MVALLAIFLHYGADMGQADKNRLVIAAFLMDGLRDAANENGGSLSDILKAWEAGYIELVQVMTDYVDFIEACFNAGYEAADGCPGVFDYDVTSEIGQWMAKEILSNGELPPKSIIENEIVRSATSFFSSGASEKDAGLIADAIRVAAGMSTPTAATSPCA